MHTHTRSQVDGEKVNDGNVDQLSHEERLSRVRDFFTKSGKMAPPITKPKPKPKKPSVVVTGEDAMDGSTTQELSPSSTEVGTNSVIMKFLQFQPQFLIKISSSRDDVYTAGL